MAISEKVAKAIEALGAQMRRCDWDYATEARAALVAAIEAEIRAAKHEAALSGNTYGATS